MSSHKFSKCCIRTYAVEAVALFALLMCFADIAGAILTYAVSRD